ncbi:radical SAM family heme chaperone HemW [Allochromatium vinosum]|uniref:Heme chaperone HemW n=1 Tax=Allochromatium vinosum (strain ATCC 17899 / DSM 180 / NBRC 103801 / NCIMB 10441 / D) TaxID=572477 RepID=D3RS12_ALLVD|nr:radical SAM family heme chaperone HemW [Allochromatium vinosum]ADC63949.1 oxygen-independent coproporphyrinogen III oxidase [Allochromatium vinosum DSM 180]MBK1654389.1 YggW family oxidoreductase [Allochromatium vinosum]
MDSFEYSPPPLALYVHLPWCVRKCPYCDFNSHPGGRESRPFDAYVERLQLDLDAELREPAARRPIGSIFIGGGTPSLFPGPAIRRLLDGIRARVELIPDAEITLEANPGTIDAAHFAAYREAGINRLSIGVQSLSTEQLERLGRIHTPEEAREAVRIARALGFDNLNLDLMFGLPGQTLDGARADLDALIALEPEHVSYYQLTVEPGTAFGARPPELPDGDLVADMGAEGAARLESAGYGRYEVSAYARRGRQCRHNLNYWRFGDYLGIGAGAHGKLSAQRAPTESTMPWRVWRTEKPVHPNLYLNADPSQPLGVRRDLSEADLILEFVLNALRLTDGFEPDLFTATTGLPWSRIAARLQAAADDRLLSLDPDRVAPTPLGRDFLDDLVARFLAV